jgi:inner membrane protein
VTESFSAANTPPGASAIARLVAAPAAKAVSIGALLLMILIPLHYVSGIIQEREARQADIVREFQGSWGPAQSVVGPILVVPYSTSPDRPRRYLHIAPSELKAMARLNPELRKRGLFHSVVYTADLRLSGRFAIPPDLAAPGGGGLAVVGGLRDADGIRSARNEIERQLDLERPRTSLGRLSAGRGRVLR